MRLLLHPASIVGCSRIRNLMNYIHAWSQATQMPFSLSKCSGVSSPSSCTSWVWVMSQVLHSKLNKISLERGPQGEWTPFTPRTSFKGKCVVGGSFQHEHESLQQFTLTYWTLNIHNILIPMMLQPIRRIRRPLQMRFRSISLGSIMSCSWRMMSRRRMAWLLSSGCANTMQETWALMDNQLHVLLKKTTPQYLCPRFFRATPCAPALLILLHLWAILHVRHRHHGQTRRRQE